MSRMECAAFQPLPLLNGLLEKLFACLAAGMCDLYGTSTVFWQQLALLATLGSSLGTGTCLVPPLTYLRSLLL